MKKNSKLIWTVAAFLIAGLLIGHAYVLKHSKKAEFENLQHTIAGYAPTSPNRVGKAVITLPSSTVIVGLTNGYGQYTPAVKAAAGTVTVFLDRETAEFFPGVEGGAPPRLDVAAPMFISGDAQGGSTYVTLFNDRGDVALEKSYVRLGGPDIAVSHIAMLPGTPGYEYRVDISYTQQGQEQTTGAVDSNTKEVIVPVLDGHFDPKGTVELK